MTALNYVRCLANTLNEEGGWTNHPSDPGGPTMRGIIQREYTKYRARHGLPNQSVRNISEAELQSIYRNEYWEPIAGDLWPKGADQIAFDVAVNHGLGRVGPIMRAALGTEETRSQALANRARAALDKVAVVKLACARRARFYRQIRTFSVFGRGWMARNARMEAIGVKMALEAQGGSLKAGLEREKNSAEGKAKRAGRGAATAGGGTVAGGGSLTQAGAWDWTAWLTIGLVVAGAVALTLALIWTWRKHGERAKAYAAALADDLEISFGALLTKVKEAA